MYSSETTALDGLLGDPVRLFLKIAWPGRAAVLLTLIAGAICPPAAFAQNEAGCATEGAALHAMLDTEYAFGEKAQASVRGAFLEYLAKGSWILNPAPEPGPPVYKAAKDNEDKLEWYPVIGDVAPSGDLGFTTGPWVYTDTGSGSGSGRQRHGHFLTIWRRDAQCQWRVQFDGGISHATPTSLEPKLRPDQAPFTNTELPPPNLVTHDAAGHAVSDFQDTAQRDGMAAALRTYGRDNDFLFYTDGQSPIGIVAANAYLTVHAIVGAWKEEVGGRSADSTLVYSVGELTDGSGHRTHAYAQIWQYDPKVANWGLRMLLVNPLPPPKTKS
jgi:hypothetical protein